MSYKFNYPIGKYSQFCQCKKGCKKLKKSGRNIHNGKYHRYCSVFCANGECYHGKNYEKSDIYIPNGIDIRDTHSVIKVILLYLYPEKYVISENGIYGYITKNSGYVPLEEFYTEPKSITNRRECACLKCKKTFDYPIYTDYTNTTFYQYCSEYCKYNMCYHYEKDENCETPMNINIQKIILKYIYSEKNIKLAIEWYENPKYIYDVGYLTTKVYIQNVYFSLENSLVNNKPFDFKMENRGDVIDGIMIIKLIPSDEEYTMNKYIFHQNYRSETEGYITPEDINKNVKWILNEDSGYTIAFCACNYSNCSLPCVESSERCINHKKCVVPECEGFSKDDFITCFKHRKSINRLKNGNCIHGDHNGNKGKWCKYSLKYRYKKGKHCGEDLNFYSIYYKNFCHEYLS